MGKRRARRGPARLVASRVLRDISRGFILKYPEGLKFECTRCGRCCRERAILLLPEDVERLSAAYGLDPEEFAEPVEGLDPYTHKMKKRNGACVFYRDGECTVYPHRPLACRFYPFALLPFEGEYVFILLEKCPGVGRGNTLGREFFEELLALYFKWALDRMAKHVRRAVGGVTLA